MITHVWLRNFVNSCTKSQQFFASFPITKGAFHYSTKTKARFRPKTRLSEKSEGTVNDEAFKNENYRKKINAKRLPVHVNGEVLYGIYPVLLALKSDKRKFHHIYYNDNSIRTKELVELATSKGVSAKAVNREFLNELSKNSTKEWNVHQGVCADVEKVKIDKY